MWKRTKNDITATFNGQPHNIKQSSENVTTDDDRYRHITITIRNSAENPLRTSLPQVEQITSFQSCHRTLLDVPTQPETTRPHLFTYEDVEE